MPGRKIDIFKRNRCGSPSFEIPKLCLSRQSRTVSIEVEDQQSPCSLNVPLQERGRSSSFDASSLLNEKNAKLQVPLPGRRCHSFDSSTSAASSAWSGSSDENLSDRDCSSKSFGSLKVPKSRTRRRPSLEIPKLCIHCVHMESYWENKRQNSESFDSSETYDSEEFYTSSDSEFDFSSDIEIYLSDSDLSLDKSCNELSFEDNESTNVCDRDITPKQNVNEKVENDLFTNAVTLEVPVIKQRSSSFDGGLLRNSSNFEKKKGLDVPSGRGTLQRQKSFEDGYLDVKNQVRSTSVDVNLPTEETKHYKAITGSPTREKAISKSSNYNTINHLHPSHAEHGFHWREPRSTVDWSDQAVNGDHMWVETNASGDYCYTMEPDCLKTGPRKKCVACKIVAHTGCISILEKKNLRCKPTFREAGVRNYREQTFMRHHWVHRWRQEGKCKQCGKSFQQRFAFQSKEIIAISCSWCKAAYHNKISCFMMQHIEEQCTLGPHQSIIVPPSWIIKLPKKGSFKSSLRKKRRSSIKKKKNKEEHKPFIIKPIPSPLLKPLLVFINPKSGGNQGAKIIHKFCWWLNPRQVFDLSQGGPKSGLDMYKKVPNLRILACGGDGTVGWILSVIDSLGIQPPPPVAIMPLGTGNDLSRTLNWGGGYADEPITKVLNYVEEGQVVQLDRVESMTMHRGQELNIPINPKMFEVDKARDSLIPMGITSENVAERFGVSRDKQDRFALASQERAARAQKSGAFDEEIVAVTTTVKDKDGNEKSVTVSKDEGIRPTTLETLLKLRPAFKEGGSTTAGNSSQVSDGAAAVLLARRSEANRRSLPVFGVLRGYAVAGCPPDIMGIGPAVAIPELLKKTGLTVADIEIFEINEAFASQAAYCVEKLGIPHEKVNPLGGAIALGHPLGCTGARQIATLLHELKRRGKRAYGVVSMCMGTGMGAAALIEYPGPS